MDGRRKDSDDKTSFHCSLSEMDKLKPFLKIQDFSIYRDAENGDNELDFLVRPAFSQPCLRFSYEMIPLNGKVDHLQFGFSEGHVSDMDYALAPHAGGVFAFVNDTREFDDKLFHGNAGLQVWYSKEDYLAAAENPNEELNLYRKRKIDLES